MPDNLKIALKTINSLQKENDLLDKQVDISAEFIAKTNGLNKRLQKVVDAAVEWRSGPFEAVFPIPDNKATAELRKQVAAYKSDRA